MNVVNKDLWHNGKHYAKGSSIQESDAGFAELKKAGHVEVKIEAKPAPAIKPVAEPIKVDEPNMDEDTVPIPLPDEVVEEIVQPKKKRARK